MKHLAVPSRRQKKRRTDESARRTTTPFDFRQPVSRSAAPAGQPAPLPGPSPHCSAPLAPHPVRVDTTRTGMSHAAADDHKIGSRSSPTPVRTAAQIALCDSLAHPPAPAKTNPRPDRRTIRAPQRVQPSHFVPQPVPRVRVRSYDFFGVLYQSNLAPILGRRRLQSPNLAGSNPFRTWANIGVSRVAVAQLARFHSAYVAMVPAIRESRGLISARIEP